VPEPRAIALSVAGRIRAAGHEALFAGGCVRDHLLGRSISDYDIATSAPPDAVQALFERTVAVGAAFGVIIVVEDGAEIEVATFREDVGIADGRHPEAVRFTDARADAARRDFTVNGMFEDPESGAVLDYVGGRKDLRRGVVRAIGDPIERFREDRLRMLRAVRFATVLDFVIDRPTRAAIVAECENIAAVSAERVRDELTKILISGRGGRGLGLLHEVGLLERLLPEVAALVDLAHDTPFHPEGDVFTHTRLLLDNFRGGGEALAWAALLHDIGKAPTVTTTDRGRRAFFGHESVGAEMSVAVLDRLRLPRRTTQQVERLVARHMVWPNLPKMRIARQRRFLLDDEFELHRELHRLDCAACHNDLSLHRWSGEERARLDAEPPPLELLLSGRDLIAMGYAPGPPFSVMLEELKDAQLSGAVPDAESARKFIVSRFALPNGKPLAEDGV
jgi:poly(A) polymerase